MFRPLLLLRVLGTLGLLTILALLNKTAPSSPWPPAPPGAGPAALSGAGGPRAAGDPGGDAAPLMVPGRTTVRLPVHYDTSLPLRALPPRPIRRGARAPEHEPEPARAAGKPGGDPLDPVLQLGFGSLGALALPPPIRNFEGVGNLFGGAPPDLAGDVGPRHYVQWINLSFQIFSRTGTSLLGPLSGDTLWSGFGGPCEANNDGDPIVLYDALADRWLLSQFSVSGPGFFQCLALSATGDPTGAYHRYAYEFPHFNDYPKLGIWPDGYYLTTVNFNAAGTDLLPSSLVAFNRAQMLVGGPAAAQEFLLSAPSGRVLPADLDGPQLPPGPQPALFLSMVPPRTLYLWRMAVDWDDPENSTLTRGATLTTASFDDNLCLDPREACVPQPDTLVDLEALSDRLMYRLVYRNMGSYQVLLANHTVDGPGIGRAAVRWYEIRNPHGSPSIYQQGTYAPDALHRWMASLAMDRAGAIALGYSASSNSTFPSIRYTGRLASDPLGELPQGEGVIINGSGSQTGFERWGDYTTMSIDPLDDCTFWYTNEYLPTTSAAGWHTRIAAFQLPACTLPACGLGADYVVSTSSDSLVPGTTDIGNHCDDCRTTVALPFPVQFYGQTFTTASVSSNGLLRFGGLVSTSGTPTCLPAPGLTNTIAAHWDDLQTANPGGGCPICGIFATTTGTAPHRIFHLEWRATRAGVGGLVEFQVRFPEDGSAFDIVYGTVTNAGRGATVGVQRGTNSPVTQFGCAVTTLQAGLKLTFQPRPCTTGCDANYEVTRISGAFGPAAGAPLPGSQCDDCTLPLTLPFPVHFYGEEFASVTLSSNGTIQFGSADPSATNTCLPAPPFQGALLPYWDNLDLRPTITNTFVPGIYTTVVGSTPGRVLIVEWRGCLQGDGSCNHKIDFTVRLNEGTNLVYFTYGSVANGGVGATIGLQQSPGALFTPFSCSTPALVDSSTWLGFDQPQGTVLHDAIVVGDPLQTGRLVLDEQASRCIGHGVVCPGVVADTAARRYKAYAFHNPSPSAQCFTIALTAACSTGSSPISSAVYLTAFDPTQVCANYRGDLGRAPSSAGAGSYSVNVPGGATFVVVVYMVDPNTTCGGYTLSVSGGGGTCVPRVPLP